MKSILFVGMDVHKNSFNLCCYNSYTGEYIEERKCASVVSAMHDESQPHHTNYSLYHFCEWDVIIQLFHIPG